MQSPVAYALASLLTPLVCRAHSQGCLQRRLYAPRQHPSGPTASGNATDPAQAPLLSGVGGAGLILVFVACALLFVILIAAFIIRGLRGPRSMLDSGGAPWDDIESPMTRPPSPALGEKPRMSDLYISTSTTQRYASHGATSWRNVQPLSASMVIESVSLPNLPKAKRASISSVDSSHSQDFNSQSSVDLKPPPRYGIDLGSRSPHFPPALNPTSPKPLNVRVVLPIAMPRQPASIHNPWNTTSPHDVDFDKSVDSYFAHPRSTSGSQDGGNILEFCVGVAEVGPTSGGCSGAEMELKNKE
ncbi:hypothetical protein BDY19DRAFT_769330 [Irpex rosettiformis]|uniref:Uncharacterized protein n=1 Tax=Irpex rosettiformis TaxID=378272 RepID=A0ACB8U819_9APHY|nr:hypothetical protein BDY19DRAFT_769330 [Irpex rosettiformis]